jgi:type I restriction enzyme M protein
MKNKFCDLADLTNEASVETWLVDRLLADLKFQPSDIRLKTSLKEMKVGKGSKSALYKPDYVIQVNETPTLVIDAKSPDECIDEFTYQCSSYCLELNKAFDYNPVHYYLLTNGKNTALYQWDRAKPLLQLAFDDVNDARQKYQELKQYIDHAALHKKSICSQAIN